MAKGDGAVATFGCAIVFAWFFGVLVVLGFAGVAIWAIIRLVSHYT